MDFVPRFGFMTETAGSECPFVHSGSATHEVQRQGLLILYGADHHTLENKVINQRIKDGQIF